MNKQEHKERHEELHKALDELIADYISHTDGRMSTTSLLDFMKWSYQQTISPDKHEEPEK